MKNFGSSPPTFAWGLLHMTLKQVILDISSIPNKSLDMSLIVDLSKILSNIVAKMCIYVMLAFDWV